MRRRSNIKITQIIAAAGDVAHQLQSLHFSNFRPVVKCWQPAVNAYCQSDGIDLCVDLAGVQKDHIEIVAEPQQILIRGRRRVPYPRGATEEQPACCKQLLLMEIENGLFERVIDLPERIDPEKTKARKDDGYLWIHLLY